MRAIATNTTGVPHIDMKEAATRNIKVFSLKDEGEFLKTITPTAEHTWGLLLALMRRSPWAHGAVLQGQWNRRPFGAPQMLSRMSLGLIGFGRLGRMVGRSGLAFGMRVAFFDPYLEGSPPGFERIGTLEELVAASDVVSLHAPANESTYKTVNRDLLEKFQTGSYFKTPLEESWWTRRLAGNVKEWTPGGSCPGRLGRGICSRLPAVGPSPVAYACATTTCS